MYIHCLYGIIYFFCVREYIAVYILSRNKVRLYYIFTQICVSFRSEFKSAKMLLSEVALGVEQELWKKYI